MMDRAEYAILVLNFIFGTVGGWLLAVYFARLVGEINGKYRLFLILLFVYLIECVAFSAGMATNIFTFGTAFVWGIVLGLWLRKYSLSHRKIVKTLLFFSLFTSLPALSFISIPLIMSLGDMSITTVKEGIRFGIPEFVPYPFNTILGFCITVSTTALIFKMAITTGLGVLILRHEGVKAKPAL
jgi:hypothetical protein